MWSFKGIVVICCIAFISTISALPTTAKKENEPEPPKPEAIILEAFALPSEKPAENAKPSDLAVDPKPTIDVKPTEQTKPEAFGSTSTVFETIPLNLASSSSSPPRRQFLYDQRQDGKYNIRADLENFVILVVPSSGNSLLDLLKRSNQRPQHTKRTHNGKHHHKKYVGSAGKPATASVNKHVSANRMDYLNRPDAGDVGGEQQIGGEYIEGRTPYHVDISSAEIIQPSAYGSMGDERSLSSDTASIADIPLQLTSNTDNAAATSLIDSNATPSLVSTLKGKQAILQAMPTLTMINTNTYPRLRKSLTIDGYGIPSFSNSNSVLLTPNQSRIDLRSDSMESPSNRNYNNYFSSKHSVQIVNSNIDDDTADNQVIDSAKLLNANSKTASIEFTDLKNSFNSLNVGNIDRLALAGDSTAKTEADFANAQWELSLLGAEEQCGPDRRRDSYGVCQFVPADYATT